MSELITTNIDKDGDLWIKNVTEGGENIVFTKDCMTQKTAKEIIHWLRETFVKTKDLLCPGCHEDITVPIDTNLEDFHCPNCGWAPT